MRVGIDPVVRKEMLGYTSIDMTDGVYGHTTPKMHQEAAQEIDHIDFGEDVQRVFIRSQRTTVIIPPMSNAR
jgi:hypothetical protein